MTSTQEYTYVPLTVIKHERAELKINNINQTLSFGDSVLTSDRSPCSAVGVNIVVKIL